MVEWAGGVESLVNKNLLTTTYSTFSNLTCKLKDDLDGIQEVVVAMHSLGDHFTGEFVNIRLIENFFAIISGAMENGELDRLAFKQGVKELKEQLVLRSSPPEIIRSKP